MFSRDYLVLFFATPFPPELNREKPPPPNRSSDAPNTNLHTTSTRSEFDPSILFAQYRSRTPAYKNINTTTAMQRERSILPSPPSPATSCAEPQNWRAASQSLALPRLKIPAAARDFFFIGGKPTRLQQQRRSRARATRSVSSVRFRPPAWLGQKIDKNKTGDRPFLRHVRRRRRLSVCTCRVLRQHHWSVVCCVVFVLCCCLMSVVRGSTRPGSSSCRAWR